MSRTDFKLRRYFRASPPIPCDTFRRYYRWYFTIALPSRRYLTIRYFIDLGILLSDPFTFGTQVPLTQSPESNTKLQGNSQETLHDN